MVSTHTLKSWSETPRTLCEEMAFGLVTSKGCLGTPIEWKGATREPFLTMEANGATKQQIVVRLSDGVVTVHFWQSTDGQRSHLKVKTT